MSDAPDQDEPDRGAESGPVFRLIYSSHSRIAPDDSREQLGSIFSTARRNNRRLGITGALVVTADAFVQALEGEEAAVRGLYDDISRDARHDNVKLVEAGTVEGRTFGRWAMAKVAADGGPDIRLVSNAQRGRIVEAGADHHVTDEQERMLGLMRGAVA